jgi:serine/threonine protein kinase/Flp pilus assembly protein TadD
MPLDPGTRLGPYVVEAPLGAGGMGEVYRARDERLGRAVALKVLPEAFASDPERLRRFETEARAAAAISHPNVLVVHDVSASRPPFVVFELLEGQTLRERMATGGLAAADAVDFARQITRGLAAAHDKGVVHRDLKPDNVFITRDGLAKILDFGLARIDEGVSSASDLTSLPTLERTAAHAVLGTVGYMSPEQVRGLPVDHRSDLFSLGVLLYEMLTGQRAFSRGSVAESQAAILRDEPPAPVPGRPLPPGVDRVVRRCLAKGPEERFPTARELLFALETVGSATQAAPTEEKKAPSIAVLPFADLSPTRDQEYFCDGLAEELIAALARIRGVRVASRTSSFQFRGSGADVRSIGERLGVGAILEGSVRRAGDRLRVSVQLVSTSDGYQLWSERYDRQADDVFAIQEEIAQSVTGALQVVLSERDKDALQARRAASLEAYELYLRGRRVLNSLRQLRSALPLFERAIQIDPGFALAHAGLAELSHWLYAWSGGREEDRRRAESASRRALDLCPDLAEVHAARGAALALGPEHDGAATEFEAAIRLNPQLWEAYWMFGRMRFAEGRRDEAERLWAKARVVRPEDYQVPLLMAMLYRGADRASELEATQRQGIELARRQLAREPDDIRAMYLCAGALVEQGSTEEGLSLLERALEMAENDPSVLYNAACVFARAGRRERALEALQACLHRGWGNPEWIAQDPDFDSVREDPRFQAMVARAPGD